MQGDFLLKLDEAKTAAQGVSGAVARGRKTRLGFPSLVLIFGESERIGLFVLRDINCEHRCVLCVHVCLSQRY